nr:fibrinogen-binding protein [Natrialba sp. INN-245]
MQSAGVLGAVGLAGCLEGVQEHFEGSVQGVVPIEIYSESDQYYNVQLVAYERETNRQTYEEAYAVTPGENVIPPHLEGVYQTLRITRFDVENDDETEVREVTITPDTGLVLVWLDEDFVVEVRREDSGETINETEDAGESDEVPVGPDDGVPVGDDPDSDDSD